MLTLLLLAAVGAVAASPLLFRRQSSTYPAAGTVGPAPKPEWVATYNAAKAAGKIPNIAKSWLQDGNVVYPQGTDGQAVCSWTLTGCFGPNDIHEAPDGMYGVSFDDGPLADSPTLYRFLQENNQTATHFFIGSNMLANPDIFAQALASGGHIGVHTFSHPYMTTLTDEHILGELGWTAQIIHDLSGGLVPRYWRPPYGDADKRVRAIAEEVFGLTLVAWNHDSDDWCLNDGGGSSCGSSGPANLAALEHEILGWINGGSSPGVIGLEHELSAQAVSGFINTYPRLDAERWDTRCIPDLFGQPWYQNAIKNGTPVVSNFPIGHGSTSLALTSTSSSMHSPPPTPTPTAATALSENTATSSPAAHSALS
ncbi:hypothetical protein JCM8202v2_000761 [Rhodotorula sphaerocarpa]